MASRWYGARGRLAGLRLVATDTDWASGPNGQLVAGPLTDLLLVATGRPAGLAGVHGGGLDCLRARLVA